MKVCDCCWRRPKSTLRSCFIKPASTLRSRGVRQASKADPRRTASSHQEHSGDCKRHRLAEPAQRAGRRTLQHAIEGACWRSAAHDLLLQARWTSADLGKVVRGATEAFDNPDAAKFTIDGPTIPITSGAVIAIAIALNELCTNTTKFGALSAPTGHVDIAWTLDTEKQRVHLTWTEKDGPPVEAPSRQSSAPD